MEFRVLGELPLLDFALVWVVIVSFSIFWACSRYLKDCQLIEVAFSETYKQLALNPNYRSFYTNVIVPLAKKSKILSPAFSFLAGDKDPVAGCMVTKPNRSYLFLHKIILNLPEDEVVAIIAHEFGHIVEPKFTKIITYFCDAFQKSLLGGVVVVGMIVGLSFFFPKVPRAYPLEVSIIVVYFLLMISYSWFKRSKEFRADWHSAYLLGNPHPLIRWLERVIKWKEEKDIGIFERIFPSHPASSKRIERLMKYEKRP